MTGRAPLSLATTYAEMLRYKHLSGFKSTKKIPGVRKLEIRPTCNLIPFNLLLLTITKRRPIGRWSTMSDFLIISHTWRNDLSAFMIYRSIRTEAGEVDRSCGSSSTHRTQDDLSPNPQSHQIAVITAIRRGKLYLRQRSTCAVTPT